MLYLLTDLGDDHQQVESSVDTAVVVDEPRHRTQQEVIDHHQQHPAAHFPRKTHDSKSLCRQFVQFQLAN